MALLGGGGGGCWFKAVVEERFEGEFGVALGRVGCCGELEEPVGGSWRVWGVEWGGAAAQEDGVRGVAGEDLEVVGYAGVGGIGGGGEGGGGPEVFWWCGGL